MGQSAASVTMNTRSQPSALAASAAERAEKLRVELEGRHQVTAHLASPVGRNYVRVIVGDRVRVQLMANDPGRGRIVEKL